MTPLRGTRAHLTPPTVEQRDHVRTRMGRDTLEYIEGLEALRRAVPEELLTRPAATRSGATVLMAAEIKSIREAARRLPRVET